MRIETTLAVAACAFALGAWSQVGPVQNQKAPALGIQKPKTRKELVLLVESLNKDLANLNRHEAEILKGFRTLADKGAALSTAAERVATLSKSGRGGENLLAKASQEVQEMSKSFNLQYLQLQTAMQIENRKYEALARIMKTKHETVKNSISNIR